jgi:hypothetical protein
MFKTSIIALSCLVILCFSPALLAAKTDVVVLKNGDKITGDIKSLSRGKLEFSTDSMGTVYIEWDDIEALFSDTGQAVELTNGQRFYGPLSKSENVEMVQVSTEQGQVGVGTQDIVTLYPVESGFWDRLDVSASLGFSWDKGSSVGKYTLGLDSELRNPKFITQASFNAEVTSQEDRSDTSRANLNALHMVFKPQKRYTAYFGSLEKNDELGLDLRALLGAGYGWVPIRSNRNWVSLSAGLDVNREIPTEGAQQTNLEAVAMLSYEYYRYSHPVRRFSSRLTVFPSITDFGRWRASFNTDFRLEIINDFFWALSVYADYDSKPISVDASNIDYGITNGLEYKF